MIEVLKDSKNIKELKFDSIPSCVYFLVKGKEIIYIGQSINIYKRITSHKSSISHGNKDFDKVYYIPINKKYLNQVEYTFIRYLKPRLNKGNAKHYQVSNLDKFKINKILDQKVFNILEFKEIITNKGYLNE